MGCSSFTVLSTHSIGSNFLFQGVVCVAVSEYIFKYYFRSLHSAIYVIIRMIYKLKLLHKWDRKCIPVKKSEMTRVIVEI